MARHASAVISLVILACVMAATSLTPQAQSTRRLQVPGAVDQAAVSLPGGSPDEFMEEAREAAPSRPREQATDDGDSFGSGLLAPAIPTPTTAERVLADVPVRRILPFDEPYHPNIQPRY